MLGHATAPALRLHDVGLVAAGCSGARNAAHALAQHIVERFVDLRGGACGLKIDRGLGLTLGSGGFMFHVSCFMFDNGNSMFEV